MADEDRDDKNSDSDEDETGDPDDPDVNLGTAPAHFDETATGSRSKLERPVIQTSELFLTRRLSGLPLMYHSNDTSKVIFSERAAKEFNKLLDRFPKPPEDADSSVTASSTSSGKQSTSNPSKTNWGSFKGFAEKLYSFNKN